MVIKMIVIPATNVQPLRITVERVQVKNCTSGHELSAVHIATQVKQTSIYFHAPKIIHKIIQCNLFMSWLLLNGHIFSKYTKPQNKRLHKLCLEMRRKNKLLELTSEKQIVSIL